MRWRSRRSIREGALRRHESDDIIDPQDASTLAWHVQSRDRLGVIPLSFAEAELDVVVLVQQGITETRDFLFAAHHEAHGSGDVIGIDSQVGGAGAIDLHTQLRLVQLECGIGIHDPQFLGSRAQLLSVGRQDFEFGATDDEVDVEISGADVERWHVAHQRTQLSKLPESASYLLHDVALRVVAAEGLQGITGEDPLP
jgi:hypothetical protein